MDNEHFDPGYFKIMRYKNMVREISKFADKKLALVEFERLQKTGACSIIPPILGLIFRIGYFEDKSIIRDAIAFLQNWEE